MKKEKTQFSCQSCGALVSKWQGQCPECKTWNSLVEEIVRIGNQTNARLGYSGTANGQSVKIADVPLQQESRQTTYSQELDRVLGGGLVAGSVVLLGGDPGIGKSTVLLQTLTKLSQQQTILYVTGEESLQQIALRAHRLGLSSDQLTLLTETEIEAILNIATKEKPQIMAIDSIQTIFSTQLQAAAGSVSQIRESTAQLVQFAKQNNVALFLVGHVTKEGLLAGPRVLEHMVDTVLYFEGEQDSRFRVIRAVKNRFGAVNELGIFAMTDKGLKEVANPSAIFLSRYEQNVSGSSVMVTWEGSRPILIEVQALVDSAYASNPRRITVGLDQNRLAMLLAVLNRHGGICTRDQDVFLNVVGGIKITETASDLASIAAIVSSLRSKPLASKQIWLGEVGLAGEIRPVQNGQERLREAEKHGFTHAVIPKANMPRQPCKELTVHPVATLAEALQQLA